MAEGANSVLDGLFLPSEKDPEKVRQAMHYKLKKDEVLVASYPKCGTTWIFTIVMLLLRKGEPITTADEWWSSTLFLESNLPEIQRRVSKIKCILTHLSFDRLTYSPDGKYIYVTRNPADCVVSYYHYVQYLAFQLFTPNTFDQVFDHFLRGEVLYGDYFDNLLSWYGQRKLPNVLFLTYESVKRDTKGAILKIAEFLDDSLIGELIADDEAMLNKVLHYSSLQSMKESVNRFYEEDITTPRLEENTLYKYMQVAKKRGFNKLGRFVRNGEVGEGKNTLSGEQKKRLNARILEKTAHSDVMDLWKDV